MMAMITSNYTDIKEKSLARYYSHKTFYDVSIISLLAQVGNSRNHGGDARHT